MKPIFTRVVLLLIVPLCFSKSSFSQCGAVLSSPANDFSVAASTVLNTYYPGTGSPVKGSTFLTVGSPIGNATNIANGDMVLIIQMQGAEINSANSDAYGDGVAGGNASGYLNTNLVAGTFEYNIVSTYNSTTGVVTLQNGIANNYYTRAYSSTVGAQRYQLIRVPRYYNFTINTGRSVTGTAWDGSAGGVIVLEATNTFTFAASSSSINANALGYRGGGGKRFTGTANALTNTDYRWSSPVTTTGNNTGGAKGEGIAGTPMYIYVTGTNATTTNIEGYVDGSLGRGAPGNAGGGGTDGDIIQNQYNTGGGGGGNGGAGGRGGSGWDGGPGNPATYNTGGFGGSAFAHASEMKIVMGGGGGAGTANNATGGTNDYLCSGAAGGGIVIIRAKTFVGSGSITANGAASNDITATGVTDAAGGGGAGGSIIVLTNTSTIATNTTITAIATGGKGGNSTVHYAHGPGGGGGGGVVITNVLSAGKITVTGGANGLTRTGSTGGNIDNAYNATPGTGGFVRVMTTTPLLLSPGNAGSPCGILPVTLNLWNGVYRNDKTYLTWETDKGVNFSHFVIERSSDGAHYTSLGQVQASTAATLTLQYSFTDIAPAGGTNYYRLKMVDADGTYQYSGIITIRTNVQGFNVSVSPNPFTDNVVVTIESATDETVLLRVFNNDGKLVWRKSTSVSAGTNVQYFSELQALPKGIYYIKVNKQNSEAGLKLIKQ
jgi:hypothetical protein